MRYSKSGMYRCFFIFLSFLSFASLGYGDGTHRWAWGEQQVDNNGGDSVLNLWRPDPSPGVFSLSQHWYVGGSGSSTQTVEGGWQVYPGFYGTNDPVLFIFFTPDNYASGCYNLTCSGFVQVDNTWVLGGTLAPVSTDGGTQYFIRIQWQLYKGNWWLFVQGNGNYIAVGYYPGTLFGSGQMATNAQYVKYGGETDSDSAGNAGNMGSGAFASAGWTHAAYQRTIYYIDTALTSHWASLSANQPTSSCYTIDMNNNSGGSWATYFFFGGPKCPNSAGGGIIAVFTFAALLAMWTLARLWRRNRTVSV
jgi:neprosin-like protein